MISPWQARQTRQSSRWKMEKIATIATALLWMLKLKLEGLGNRIIAALPASLTRQPKDPIAFVGVLAGLPIHFAAIVFAVDADGTDDEFAVAHGETKRFSRWRAFVDRHRIHSGGPAGRDKVGWRFAAVRQ